MEKPRRRKRVWRVAFPAEVLIDVKAITQEKALERARKAVGRQLDQENGLTLPEGTFDAWGMKPGGSRLYIIDGKSHHDTDGDEPKAVDSWLEAEGAER